MTEYVRATIVNEDGRQRLVTTPVCMTETLTLRDQFAMAALTGLCSQIHIPNSVKLANRQQIV